MMQAQEISMSENYKSKKQKRLVKYKPHRAGDISLSAGLSFIGTGIGALADFDAEYMINDKVGIRGSFSSNNMSGSARTWGAHRYGVDVSYHFIQSKRWDLYAFAGIGMNRYKYIITSSATNNEVNVNYGTLMFNGGVGARYRFTPNFGMQLELGRSSSFGIFKTFNLRPNK